MRAPKICGLETEYGLVASDPSRLAQGGAAVAFVERCPLEPRVPWDLGGESPNWDARKPRGRGATGAPATSSVVTTGYGDPFSGDHAGFMLGNGARLYADHGHPEYSTPECLDALDLVASDKAGERLIERCRVHLNRFLPLGQSIRLFKNNTDHQGHSYGCHENYLVATPAYEALFKDRLDDLHAYLVPFLVSRIVVCGAGKVGSEHGRPAVPYQISQRADFFETVVGLETMSHRPIVNTRDEPHADPARFRRLHVICGDANMAEVSTYLKVGTMQLLLAMLEDGAPLADLTLVDPVAALMAISHDPECRATVELEDGRRLTAVEIQEAFAEAAESYLAGNAEGRTAYASIYERWAKVLRQLAADPRNLAKTLDWVIKWQFLEDWRCRKGLDWSAAELAELDLRYHDIDRERSLYYLIERSTPVERLVLDSTVDLAEEYPLSSTRAASRAEALQRRGRSPSLAGWARLTWGPQESQVLENPIGPQDPPALVRTRLGHSSGD